MTDLTYSYSGFPLPGTITTYASDGTSIVTPTVIAGISAVATFNIPVGYTGFSYADTITSSVLGYTLQPVDPVSALPQTNNIGYFNFDNGQLTSWAFTEGLAGDHFQVDCSSNFLGPQYVVFGDYPPVNADAALYGTLDTFGNISNNYTYGTRTAEDPTPGTWTLTSGSPTPPTPTTAPPISEFPTALITPSGTGFLVPLLRDTSPNLVDYVTNDTVIPQVVNTVTSNYKPALNTLDGRIDTASQDIGITGMANAATLGDLKGGALSLAAFWLATPMAQSVLSAPMRKGAQLALDAKVVADAMLTFAETAEVPVVNVVTFTGIILAATSLALDWLHNATMLAIAADPPDPNYQQVFVPAPIVTAPLPATAASAALQAAAQSTLTDIDQATKWMYAVDVTENRYATALGAGNTNAASMQYVAFLDYLGLYMNAAQVANVDLASLSSQLQANNIGTQLATAQGLTTALNTAAAQGTSGVSSLFESLGFTPTQIQTVAQEAQTTPASLPSETAVQALSNLASSFSSVAPAPTVSSGQTLVVSAGQTRSGITVLSGGTVDVLSGGKVSATIIASGGREYVHGTASGGMVNSGGHQYVSAGGVASGATVKAGGSQSVLSGGTARATVLSGGSGVVSAGGTASAMLVAGGGVERVYGRASGDTVNSGGRQIIESGGVASGATVKHGGNQIVYSGGTARGTVLSGGVETVYGTASGGRVNRGGVERVYGRASGGVINGGLIEVASGGKAGGTLTFISAGTLQLDPGAGFTGVIKGFGKPSLQDQIDLRGIAFGAGTTRSFAEAASGTSGTLTVTSGSHSVHLTLLGVYATSNFKLATDGHGGTLVTDPPAALASQVTFADIAPAQPRSGAPDPGSPLNPLPGAVAASLPAPAGALLLATGLLATGPPGGPVNADHNPLLPAPS